MTYASPRAPRFASTADPATLLNGHPPADPQHAHAMCVGCGCTDASSCRLACTWAFVDRTPGHNVGVCSNCVDDPLHADIKAAIERRKASPDSTFVRNREARRVTAMLLDTKRSIEVHRGTAWVPED